MLAHLGDVFEKNRVNGQFLCGAAGIPAMWKRAMDILGVSELHRIALICKTYARPTKAALCDASQSSRRKRVASSQVVYDLTVDACDDEDGDRNGGMRAVSKKSKHRAGTHASYVAVFKQRWDCVLEVKETNSGLADFVRHPMRYTAAISGFDYTKRDNGYFVFGFSDTAVEQIRALGGAAGTSMRGPLSVNVVVAAFKVIKRKALQGICRAEHDRANHVAGMDPCLATQRDHTEDYRGW